MLMKNKMNIPSPVVSYYPINSCSDCLLSKNCVGSRIKIGSTHDSQPRSFRSFTVRNCEHLYFSGDQSEALYVVKSGSFKTYIINKGGDEQVIGFHLAGDVLNLDALPSGFFQSSAVALETSSVCAIPASYFEHLVKQQASNWLIGFFLGELSHQQQKQCSLGRKSAKRRIAAFLYDLSHDYQALGYSGQQVKLNMSREDIGNYLGLASETVSRVLTKMRKEGLFKIDKQNVIIMDLERLCELADKRECE